MDLRLGLMENQWGLRQVNHQTQKVDSDQDQMDQWDLLQRAVIHYLDQERLLHQMEECLTTQ
jgi:hypothetical protein